MGRDHRIHATMHNHKVAHQSPVVTTLVEYMPRDYKVKLIR